MEEESFDKRKRGALQALINACEHDKSPKGSVDEPIQSLVQLINSHPDYATTSSCSGRVSVFHTGGSESTQKGKGSWFLALHRSLHDSHELIAAVKAGLAVNKETPSMTIFKHEPFVLHVMCRSVDRAQAILKVAMDAGFRESGISVGVKKIMVGVRTTANVLECPVAKDGNVLCSQEFFDFLADEANKRFTDNVRRTEHFEALLRESLAKESLPAGPSLPANIADMDDSKLHELSLGWSPLSNDSQLRRWGHTASPLDAHRVLIFGGWGEDLFEKQQHAHLSHTLIWDASTHKLREALGPSTPQPTGRVYHSATLFPSDHSILIYGGRKSPQSALSDFWRFDIQSENWIQLLPSSTAAQQAPEGRWRHGAVYSNLLSAMLIFGGRSLEKVYDDLWSVSVSVSGISCQQVKCTGTLPGPRFAHALLSTNDNLLLHGGLAHFDAADGPSEIFVLDLSSKVWTKTGSLTSLTWRFSHSWIPFSAHSSLLLGGVSKNYSKETLRGEESIRIEISATNGSGAKLMKATPVKASSYDSLLMVQHCIAALPAQPTPRLLSFGGGATCFAFGSVFSSSAQLDVSQESKNAPPLASAARCSDHSPATSIVNADQPYFACDRRSAVQVKTALENSKLLDKSRKVESDEAKRILFPISSTNSPPDVPPELQSMGEIVFRLSTSKASSSFEATAKPNRDQVLARVFGSAKCKLDKVDDVLLIHSKDISYDKIKEGISWKDWTDVLSMFPGTDCVVWGAEVDEGPMRRSHNRLVFSRRNAADSSQECWVSVVENGVIFSYDMLRCMYSKGNVSEKLRFAQLVKPGEVVVDLFAGIGYFTVPALKLSPNVKILHACEWNPDAVRALRRNLKQNGVLARCVVHPGDCRRLALPAEQRAHRISLGLLPDSKVGWETAIECLREEGGWLHVHGNAPESEMELFGQQVASQLTTLSKRIRGSDWKADCVHVQRVKSYAPRVLHLVADIRCGPESSSLFTDAAGSSTHASSTKQESSSSVSKTTRRRSPAAECIAESIRRAADELLCAGGGSLTVEEARTLAADGQLLFKRIGHALSE